MTLDLATLKSIQNNFAQELQDASMGKKTSLPFIQHTLTDSPLVATDEVFQVLVVGGSVCKKAFGQKTDGAIEIVKQDTHPQPRFTSKETFLPFIEKAVDKNIKTLAINFAYPLTPVFEDKKLDGILLAGSKEHVFKGMIGARVGKLIEEHLYNTRKQKLRVSVANDTICLLLSGLTEHHWNQLAAGILGTGLNFAIFLDQTTAVNLEAANFDKFARSEEGKEIDASSARPGTALLEKETSGAYLYMHFNQLIQKRGVQHKSISSTHELKNVALEEKESEASGIARELLGYSAGLLSAVIAGIIQFQERDLIIVMDGSFFWEGRVFVNLVEHDLKQLIPSRDVTFVSIKDSTILGAAKLVA